LERLLIICIIALLPGAYAATINAASCSQADVQAAINSAVDGDTVNIPAGTCEWGAGNTFINVNKKVTLQAAGKGQTTIDISASAGAYTSGTIRISDAAVVRSFTIRTPVSGNSGTAFSASADGFRISDIEYLGRTENINGYFVYSGSYGLIDSCKVTGDAGNNELIFARGPLDSWQTPSSIGQADNLFIEDNEFNGHGYICDCNSNSRCVARYNTINGPMKVDGHGKASNGPPRGVRHMEIYNNQWTNPDLYWTAIEVRGGTGVIFNNTANVAGSGAWFYLTDYGYTATWPNFDNQCQCPSDYPVDDQIGVGQDPKTSEPLYLWNNKNNGNDWVLEWRSTSACHDTCGIFDLQEVIKSGRDYYIVPKPGYVPYTYPHPLRSQNVANYWVSPSGSASWTNCKSAMPLSGSAACSLATANSNAKAGDTIILRAGTYGTKIQPTGSGSAGNYISYEAYSNEDVVLTSNRAIYLINNQYIKVSGLRADLNLCTSMGCYVEIDNSNNNLIENCQLDHIKSQSGWPNGVLLRKNAHHNIFRNNRIGNAGLEASGPEDAGGTMRLGSDAGDDGSGHNLFEANEIFNGGHHVVEIYTSYNVFRNNLFHNDNWYDCSQAGGLCGNRNFIFDGPLDDAGHNIVEGNRIAFAGIPADSYASSGISLRSGNNIIRYNSIYHSDATAMSIEQYGYWDQPHDVSFNHIYNNVFYHNGYFNGDGWWAAHYGILVADQDYTGIQDLKIKNNIFFENQAGPVAWSHSAERADQEMVNNLEGPDPMFTNAKTGGPDSWVLPDFSLLESSPAIDAGGELTFVAASDSGSGTLFIVDNAGYFQDGSWVNVGLMEADWISVGNPDHAVQIASISGNTITLANSISRSDNDPVYLYKKSDGEQVLYGALPDIGAHEYSGGCIEVTLQLLIDYIDDWEQGHISVNQLMDSITAWKSGCQA